MMASSINYVAARGIPTTEPYTNGTATAGQNQGDITLNAPMFSPAAIPADTQAFNDKITDIMAANPLWYEVGVTKYRQMRRDGQTALPAAALEPTAITFQCPSREPGRTIPCRLLRPKNPSTKIRSVWMHLHGGGWTLQDEQSYDPYCQGYADRLGMVVISVGYRLAPENPFPRGPEDCMDVAEWLIDHAEQEYGAPLGFIGGESAGAHLTMCTLLHLLQHPTRRYADFRLRGLFLHYGAYDNRGTPSTFNFKKPRTLILDLDLIDHYKAAFFGTDRSDAEMRDPSVSPLFADWGSFRGRLPPALFTCGSEDCLLDDTVFMSCKYMMAGAETVVKIVPGAPHAYITYPPTMAGSGCLEGLSATDDFANAILG